MYFVYIIKSLKDNRKYIGQTDNIWRRLNQHNSGKVRSTKTRTPFCLIYKESFSTRAGAVKKEKFFKAHSGYNYLRRLGIY